METITKVREFKPTHLENGKTIWIAASAVAIAMSIALSLNMTDGNQTPPGQK